MVAALTGVVGVFAAGTDTATTGENDAFTGSLVSGEGDVDLEITAASFDPETGEFACGNEWTDHLATGVITSNGNDISDQYPDYPFYDEGHVCLRNVGDTTANVTMAVSDIFDTELACRRVRQPTTPPVAPVRASSPSTSRSLCTARRRARTRRTASTGSPSPAPLPTR